MSAYDYWENDEYDTATCVDADDAGCSGPVTWRGVRDAVGMTVARCAAHHAAVTA